MKTYEKPRLIAMSLSGNNTLCSSCEIDIMGDNADPTFKQLETDLGVTFTFGEAESCATDGGGIPVAGYCKFTATSNIVINS